MIGAGAPAAPFVADELSSFGMPSSEIEGMAVTGDSSKTVATRTPAGAPLHRPIVVRTHGTQFDAPSVRALLAELAGDV